MASSNQTAQVVISPDAQTYNLPNGAKASLFTKDGKLTEYIYEDVRTVYEGFLRGIKESNDGPCLGTRPSPNQPYEWIKYSQVKERFVSFGAGLTTLGIAAGQESLIGIYGQNCVEWVVADLANSAYSRVTVALYDTLGEEALVHILNQAEISCVVCNTSNIKSLIDVKKSCPQLSTIVTFSEAVAEDIAAANDVNIKIYTMNEVETKGKESINDVMPPKPNDLVTICYTSGTTGQPKGVMLTHANIISNDAAIQQQMTTDSITSEDVHISYLPLAHMYERAVQASFYSRGAQIGFFRGDIKGLVDDIQELKPTIFVSVPRLLNRLYDKITGALQGSAIKRWLFNRAYQSKVVEVQRGITRRDSFWDKLVFRKIQGLLGGRVRVILSGSAPISSSVKEFLRVVFGCAVLEGYGQTEGTAGVTFTFPFDLTNGHVGAVLSCCHVKLRDVPEMNYVAANGEGEVCFIGPSMTQGYYKNPEKTAELFDEDGWIRTGDIGKWLPNGTLKIVDRVKHIFKLSQGEYIAPEKVENVCIRSTYIAQMFLYGDSLKDYCVAIIVPDEEILMGWAKSNGRNNVSFEELCNDQNVHNMIFDDLRNVASTGGLNSLETPRVITLCKDMFSVENDLLTPTFKLKRPQARNRFHDDIDTMYSKVPAPRQPSHL